MKTFEKKSEFRKFLSDVQLHIYAMTDEELEQFYAMVHCAKSRRNAVNLKEQVEKARQGIFVQVDLDGNEWTSYCDEEGNYLDKGNNEVN